MTEIVYRSVLMCPPAYFTVRDVKNPFMESAAAVDPERAALQWQALRESFERAGVQTLTIDPVEDLEDMVFAANQTFIGSGVTNARFVVPSRMRYPSREREVPHFVRWFERRGAILHDVGLDAQAGEFLEGHGDLLQHPGETRVWASHGFRSSAAGLARFSRAMESEGMRVTPLELVDPTFYHLDTCLAPLNSDAALIYRPAFSDSALAALEQGWPRLHEVSESDAYGFACNGVAVNGYFIAAHLSNAVGAIVRDEGLEPSIVDTSEFEKAGGSVFCLKAFLD